MNTSTLAGRGLVHCNGNCHGDSAQERCRPGHILKRHAADHDISKTQKASTGGYDPSDPVSRMTVGCGPATGRQGSARSDTARISLFVCRGPDLMSLFIFFLLQFLKIGESQSLAVHTQSLRSHPDSLQISIWCLSFFSRPLVAISLDFKFGISFA